MVRPLIVGNWKMNTTLQQAKALVGQMKPHLEVVAGAQAVVCPPFVSLAAVADVLRGSTISLGAQNMYYEGKGAYTGEVSPVMLAGLCQFVILGHSERRRLFAESDGLVNKKVKSALAAGMRPILCVGENLDDREQGRAEAVVNGQLAGSLAEVISPGGLVVAYEPVWAIGTGRAATPGVAKEMMTYARKVLASLYGADAASQVPLLYGGSVSPGNTAELMQQQEIDGLLVGGASLDAGAFVEIVQMAARAKGS